MFKFNCSFGNRYFWRCMLENTKRQAHKWKFLYALSRYVYNRSLLFLLSWIPFVFQHLSPDKQEDEAHNEKGSPSVPRKRALRNKPSYDPFLLVPCRKFSTRSAVPFDVLIQSETLVVMDTHAHMSTTEVIGLLGGTYSHDSRKLKVINGLVIQVGNFFLASW